MAVGHDDVTARVIPALVGVATVAALVLLRPELGRMGTPLAMTAMTFSTAFLYYSRFVPQRHLRRAVHARARGGAGAVHGPAAPALDLYRLGRAGALIRDQGKHLHPRCAAGRTAGRVRSRGVGRGAPSVAAGGAGGGRDSLGHDPPAPRRRAPRLRLPHLRAHCVPLLHLVSDQPHRVSRRLCRLGGLLGRGPRVRARQPAVVLLPDVSPGLRAVRVARGRVRADSPVRRRARRCPGYSRSGASSAWASTRRSARRLPGWCST